MFFHKHKYDPDLTATVIGEIVVALEKSINRLAKEVKELRDDVDYMLDLLDD